MDSRKNAYFPLKTGPLTLGIRFDEPENTEAFARYFEGYRGNAGTDLRLDFTVVSHADRPDIPESLVQAKTWSDGFFSIADGLFRGRYNARDGRWEVWVKNVMTKGQNTRVFEQFLYQAFYSANKKAKKNAFLLHSSGVSVGGNGCLFVGASGAGKSTVAELSREFTVLNDEMNILSFGKKRPFLHPSPFNAYFKNKGASAAPVRAIFLLKHAKDCRIDAVTPALGVAQITGQVVPPLGIEDRYSPATAAAMMDTAQALVAAVPVFQLSFPVEGGFWPLILDFFARKGG